MNRLTKNILNVFVLLIGGGSIHLAGKTYADRMMEELTVNPSPDLYANNNGFQYVAFWFVYGFALILLLLLGMLFLNKL
jgi:hypothetical protein